MTDLNALYYTDQHEWISVDGDVATIGITTHAADQLGDVVFVELPAVGDSVESGASIGEIESTKSVGELFAPLSGEIVETNDAAVDDPSLVNTDPFGAAWLVKVRFSGELPAGLLDAAAYENLVGGAA